ncbi:hypothetical protein LUZ63_007166 [Rhynchospora breviuscula]|uniref:SHSP domain-containing protein n=1 Tax=Rhynchospora breviuscula TaxID=2022672 RepID=A0A9Q0HU49_9POAL|nr:hypothetical protein LUZ63_007166 [Rhynchospora breviuscula]
MDSGLFDAASHLLNIPETMERLVFPSNHQHGGVQENGKGRVQGEGRSFTTAPVDILETPKEYTFVIDVPGLSKSDIQVTLEEGKLLVIKSNGKRKREELEEEGSKYLRFERRAVLKFTRKFKLPDDANADAISAKCENGVLSVVVPKLPPPEKKTKTVEVKVA